MLFKEIPFLRIVLFICCGVLTGAWFSPGLYFISIALLLITAFIITDYITAGSHYNILSGIAINAAFFMSGIILYSGRQHSFTELPAKKTVFLCTLSDYPVEKAKSTLLRVSLSCIPDGDSCSPVKGSVLIYNRKDTTLLSVVPGDRLLIRCTPLPIKNRHNPYEFNYRLYMENRGFKYYALTKASDIIKLPAGRHRSLKYRALIIRRGIINTYRNLGIEGRNLAVVAAITLGQKNLLDEEQKQEFATAGVIHVMAVSGLHVMILSLFVMNILFFLKRRYNTARIILTLSVMWIFAFITGLATSVVRASLMFTFIWSGNILKRKLNPLNSLMASAFVLIIMNPGVIFDTGFLLSYAAVTFILVFYHDLYKTLYFNRYVPDKIWQMTVIALVAQAATMPLTITLFNRFPTYFLIANLIIVPMASLVVVTGCLIPLLAPLTPVARIVAALLDRLTGLIVFVTEKTAGLPHASINNAGMLPLECFLLAVTIFLFAYYLLKKRSIRAYWPLLSLLLLVAYHTLSEIRLKNTNEIIVYDVQGSTALGIRTGKILNLYSDSRVVADAVKRHCSASHLKLSEHYITDSPLYIGSGRNRFLIVNKYNMRHFNNQDADLEIVTGNGRVIFCNFREGKAQATDTGSEKTIIRSQSDKGSSRSYTGRVHSVAKSGAFIKSI
ncbi:MAG TPA: ComEC/Rec2 family competence protein [Bacteroidales bacterium]|nr:ComEC/Rec2 family competence protein [Bacteroidales bacterium]